MREREKKTHRNGKGITLIIARKIIRVKEIKMYAEDNNCLQRTF
jgi:hypothetical protein